MALVGRLILLAGFFALLHFGHLLAQAPAVNSGASPDGFDTGRAFARVERILGRQVPHIVGSPENAAVRARLTAEIAALGYTPQTDRFDSCRARSYKVSGGRTFVNCATVDNVSFWISPPDSPQTVDRDTLLLTTHYDSVGAGPGAADAMVGVASILEIAAALRTDLEAGRIKRPVLVLITDGEEVGLLGAQAFADQDPRMARIDTVVNFEARGVEGPAMMFQTSQPNSRVVAALAANGRRLQANSTMAAIYEVLPNDTDGTVYLEEGRNLLNFAIIGNERYYHTPQDNLVNLSKRSLQHMGRSGLAAARGHMSVKPAGGDGELVYMDFLGRGMIVLPRMIVIPVLLAGIAMAIFSLFRRSASSTTPYRRLIALIVPPTTVIAGVIAVFALHWLITALRFPDYWVAQGALVKAWVYLVSIGMSALVAYALARRANALDLLHSAWLWFSLVGLILAVVLPGAAILFVVPVAVYFIGALLSGMGQPGGWPLFSLATFGVVMIWAAILHQVGEALGYGMAPAIAAIAGLVVMLIIPSLVAGLDRRVAVLAGGVPLGLGLLMVAMSIGAPAFSPERPQGLTLVTVTDHREAERFVRFSRLDEGAPIPAPFREAGSIEGPDPDATSLRRADPYHRLAYAAPAQRPALARGSDGDLRLDFTGLAADRFTLSIPAEAGISRIGYGSKTLSLTGAGQIYFRCTGPGCFDKPVTLAAKSSGSSTWTLSLQTLSTGPDAAPFEAVRPAYTVPRHLGNEQRELFSLPVRTNAD